MSDEGAAADAVPKGPGCFGTGAGSGAPAFSLGARLHDLGEGSVEELLERAAELGFCCVQLPSKVVYATYGIWPEGLTPELADRLRARCAALGLRVSVFGCYKNLAVPDGADGGAGVGSALEPSALERTLDEYRACLRFAAWLGADAVGTETGRPNAENGIAADRFSDEALALFERRLALVCADAERAGVRLLIEPGWNEVVCTPERCRHVLDAVSSPALGVIYDAVSLLHPRVVGEAQDVTARMLRLCGDRIAVLHLKDFEVVANEDAPEWCDGSGSRLVCHGAGESGAYDCAQLAVWARAEHPGIDAIIENATPATIASCRDYLRGL